MHDVAVRLGEKIIEMYTDAGEWVPSWGGPGGNPRQTYIESLVIDAQEFMALDPQKITDEYFRIQGAAQRTYSGEAKAELEVAGSRLAANWHGEAATEFAKQMSYAESFMEQQAERMAFAMQALCTAYHLAVEIRRSYVDLAEAAIAACDVEMGKQAGREAKARVGLGSELVKAVIGGLGLKGALEIVKQTIDGAVSVVSKTEEIELEGSEAGEVVNLYLAGRDRLRHHWESGLWDIRDWLAQQDSALSKDSVPLLEPMPSSVDVYSPDFSYKHFYSDHHAPETYAPRVEEQRRKLIDAKNLEEPSGLIGHLLAGGER
ncbi:hypothetical protein [Actinokineospora sp. HUAS TT18]|uniref:hypothetical protein n=1 Tax=Actinokineospora sp. HUAS TT18 TaxID=3447451 RepID=UPI003F529019